MQKYKRICNRILWYMSQNNIASILGKSWIFNSKIPYKFQHIEIQSTIWSIAEHICEKIPPKPPGRRFSKKKPCHVLLNVQFSTPNPPTWDGTPGDEGGPTRGWHLYISLLQIVLYKILSTKL